MHLDQDDDDHSAHHTNKQQTFGVLLLVFGKRTLLPATRGCLRQGRHIIRYRAVCSWSYCSKVTIRCSISERGTAPTS